LIRRTTWITLGLFLVALVATWFLLRSKNTAEVEPTAVQQIPSLLDFPTSQVKVITVRDEQGSSVVYQRDISGIWRMVEPGGYVIGDEVDAMLLELISANRQGELSQLPELSQVGLAPARYEVTLELVDGNQRVLRIGDATVVGQGRYIQLEDGVVMVASQANIEAALGLLLAPPFQATATAVEATSAP